MAEAIKYDEHGAVLPLPAKFIEIMGRELSARWIAGLVGDQVFPVALREPLGSFCVGDAVVPEYLTVIRVRCWNDRGTIRFRAFSIEDQRAAEAWAERHKETTREQRAMARPREIIADNLPTFAGCYVGFTKVDWPTKHDLMQFADGIIEALRAAGYVIEERRPGS